MWHFKNIKSYRIRLLFFVFWVSLISFGKRTRFLLRKCFSHLYGKSCCHFGAGTCVFDVSDCSGGWGAITVFHPLSTVDVIQAGDNRNQSISGIFLPTTAGSWEQKYFHSQSAIGGNKANVQEEQRREKKESCLYLNSCVQALKSQKLLC